MSQEHDEHTTRMTALAGFWAYGSGPAAGAACERILRGQSLYGRQSKVDTLDAVSMGRRLHASLPEDCHDRGPLIGGGGRLLLVADVRIDNRPEIAETLGLELARLAVTSDAALLMLALERWGEETPKRLAGDYAFALWDNGTRRLMLGRDHLGHRPLHYHRGGSFFAFASMPKGLHALPEVPQEPDERALRNRLALLPETGSGTFFRGIERVEPGHLVIAEVDRLISRRWWNPRPTTLRLRSDNDYVESARALLDQAVAAQLRGTKSVVAAHLSAGLDSAGVVATAARLLVPAGGRLVAYTAVPRRGWSGKVPFGRFADEGSVAASTASLYSNVEHVRIDTSGRTPIETLDRRALLCDQPTLNPCNACWADAINDDARARGIGVLLTGQCGNMSLSFGGEQRLAALAASFRLPQLAREALALWRAGTRVRAIAAHSFGPYVPAPLWRCATELAGRANRLETYSALARRHRKDPDLLAEMSQRGLDPDYRPRRNSFEMRLWALQRVDFGPARKGALGGWGLDIRDPTADRRLIEFCLSLPAEQFLAGGVRRRLAKRVLADRLPDEVIAQRASGLQAADWHVGLTEARDQCLDELDRLEALSSAADLIDLPRLRLLAQDWPEEGWDRRERVQNYRLAMLRGIATGRFLRRNIRTNA